MSGLSDRKTLQTRGGSFSGIAKRKWTEISMLRTHLFRVGRSFRLDCGAADRVVGVAPASSLTHAELGPATVTLATITYSFVVSAASASQI